MRAGVMSSDFGVFLSFWFARRYTSVTFALSIAVTLPSFALHCSRMVFTCDSASCASCAPIALLSPLCCGLGKGDGARRRQFRISSFRAPERSGRKTGISPGPCSPSRVFPGTPPPSVPCRPRLPRPPPPWPASASLSSLLWTRGDGGVGFSARRERGRRGADAGVECVGSYPDERRSRLPVPPARRRGASGYRPEIPWLRVPG